MSDHDESSEPAPDRATPADDGVTAERDKLRDQLLRTAADYDNFRKRTRKDLEEALRRGREETIREILPVADNLERAMEASGTALDAQAVVDGVKMVVKLFGDTLERLGITRIATVGERFDPQVHEAIQQIESDTQPPGTIVAELVPGYRVGERLLRAAMVAVARPPSKTERPPPLADN